MTTTTKTQTEIIREFIALPAEAMPAATYLDEDDDMGSVWPVLRDFLRPENQQQHMHVDSRVRLVADRDGWRDGIVVTC